MNQVGRGLSILVPRFPMAGVGFAVYGTDDYLYILSNPVEHLRI